MAKLGEICNLTSKTGDLIGFYGIWLAILVEISRLGVGLMGDHHGYMIYDISIVNGAFKPGYLAGTAKRRL